MVFDIDMKICNIHTSIPKERKMIINDCMKKFNKQFKNTDYTMERNKVGIPAHLLIAGLGVSMLVDTSCFAEALVGMFITKLNLDFIPFINNINKIKASAFSRYMKNNGINDEKELLYGTRNYLANSGSYHYPILHPDKTKRIALGGEYTRSFETGLIYTRTDKKSLLAKIKRYINKK